MYRSFLAQLAYSICQQKDDKMRLHIHRTNNPLHMRGLSLVLRRWPIPNHAKLGCMNTLCLTVVSIYAKCSVLWYCLKKHLPFSSSSLLSDLPMDQFIALPLRENQSLIPTSNRTPTVPKIKATQDESSK